MVFTSEDWQEPFLSLPMCRAYTVPEFLFFCLSLLLQRISFLCLASGKMRSCLCSDVLTSCIKFLNFFKTQNILSQIVLFWFISKFHFFIQKGNIWIICQYLRWNLLSPVLCDDTPRSSIPVHTPLNNIQSIYKCVLYSETFSTNYCT